MDNMTVTSAQYIEDDNRNVAVSAVIDGQSWCVSIDPNNRHYQAILDWVAEGNTIQDAA